MDIEAYRADKTYEIYNENNELFYTYTNTKSLIYFYTEINCRYNNKRDQIELSWLLKYMPPIVQIELESYSIFDYHTYVDYRPHNTAHIYIQFKVEKNDM